MNLICPRCQRRFIAGFDSTDVVHQCNSGNKTLDQEDKVVTGDWVDYTGSKTDISAPNMQDASNKVWGTRPADEGVKVGEFTVRGNNASTTRQRQHLEYIDLKEGDTTDISSEDLKVD